MSLSFEHILELDHISSEDRDAIRSAMEADPQFKKAIVNWIAVSDHVKQNIQRDFPSSESLVLFALRDSLSPSVLGASEFESVTSAELAVSEALQQYPSIALIVKRIQEDASVFDRCWSESTDRIDRPAKPLARGPLRSMRLVRWSVSVAAVIALVMVGVTQFGPNAQSNLIQFETIAGEHKTINLEDGSTVQLAPLSSLSWNDESPRTLELEGAAFFDVVASAQTFTVQTDQGLTTVLGTSFGVQSNYNESTLVTLVSGRVGITLPGANLSEGSILSPGMQGVLSASGISVSEVNLTDALAWSELIVFKDTPMKEVVDVLTKRFEVSISLSETLFDTPLTGTFEQDRGVQEILEIVAAALGATVEKDSFGKYTVTR